MASYVVMRPAADGDAEARTVLIRDGFSVWAFVIPLFWFLWYRLWIETILIVAATALLAALDKAANFGDWPMIGLSLLVNLLAGLEGNDRRIEKLRRKGYVETGVVVARNRAEAEERCFGVGEEYSGAESMPVPAAPAPSSRPATDNGGLVGLVGHRGGA
jgi:hypothetical protein